MHVSIWLTRVTIYLYFWGWTCYVGNISRSSREHPRRQRRKLFEVQQDKGSLDWRTSPCQIKKQPLDIIPICTVVMCTKLILNWSLMDPQEHFLQRCRSKMLAVTHRYITHSLCFVGEIAKRLHIGARPGWRRYSSDTGTVQDGQYLASPTDTIA